VQRARGDGGGALWAVAIVAATRSMSSIPERGEIEAEQSLNDEFYRAMRES
jgi:hypothetical protein